MTEKLVRDRIPEIAETEGRCLLVRTATEQEFMGLLCAKLQEETTEFYAVVDGDGAGNFTPQQALDELADVMEVVLALATQLGYDKHILEGVRVFKVAQRGGFEQRLVWRDEP